MALASNERKKKLSFMKSPAVRERSSATDRARVDRPRVFFSDDQAKINEGKILIFLLMVPLILILKIEIITKGEII